MPPASSSCPGLHNRTKQMLRGFSREQGIVREIEKLISSLDLGSSKIFNSINMEFGALPRAESREQCPQPCLPLRGGDKRTQKKPGEFQLF